MIPPTRIPGRWLKRSRLAWLAVALLYGTLLVLSLPGNLRPASGDEAGLATMFRGWSPAQIDQAFAELGVSPQALATAARWSDGLLWPIYFALGLFLFWRRSDDWLALLFSVTLMGFLSTNELSNVFGAHNWTIRLDELSSALLSMISLTALLVFPDGRFAPRWTRWVGAWNIAVQVWRIGFPEAYKAAAFVVTLPTFPAIGFSYLYRYLRPAGPIERQQIKWLAISLATITPLLALYGVAMVLVPSVTEPGALGVVFNLAGMAIWSCFLIAWPAGLVVAIMRYRLWDIDVIIRRTLVYSALSALLALAYLGSVLLLQPVFGRLTRSGQTPLVTVLSTLAVAALFFPLRGRVQAFIDRRFYRGKYDAAQTLAEFAATARDETDLEQLAAQLAGVVGETMQPESVGLWLRPAETQPARPPDDKKVGKGAVTAELA